MFLTLHCQNIVIKWQLATIKKYLIYFLVFNLKDKQPNILYEVTYSIKR